MIHVLAHRHSPSKRPFSGTEDHENNDDHDRLGSNRFENRIFVLVFVAPLLLIFPAMASALTFSWSPIILGSVASAGLLALARVCQGTRFQQFENAWLILNPAIALFVGLFLLAVNAVLNGTNPIFPGYMSFPLWYNYSISSCQSPGPHRIHDCLSYDPLFILLEYFFWTLVALGLVSAVDLVTRFTARVRNRAL